MFKQKKTALYMRFATSQQVRQKTIRNRLRALAMLNKLGYDAEIQYQLKDRIGRVKMQTTPLTACDTQSAKNMTLDEFGCLVGLHDIKIISIKLSVI